MAIFGIGNKCLWIPYENAEFYRSLVPIQTGVVALIFPIMIFIIGFSGNKLAAGVNLSEVLLRESFLFPVGVIGLFFLVNLIWARSSYVVVGQIVLSALMYAIVLFRIIRILLNDKRLLEKSKELLKDKLRRSIEKTIEERLGNNILIKEFGDNKIELQYSFLDPTRKADDYIDFDLQQRGSIANINLDYLDKIAKIIERISRRNGFSFYENIINLGVGEGDVSAVYSDGTETKTCKKNQERYLRKRFMDEVTDEHPHVLSVRRELLNDQSAIDEIKDILNKAFIVRKTDEDNDKLRIELRNLKDQLIDDIRNKRLGRIDNLREVYIALAELFLDIMKSYSSNYTMEAARKERSNIVGEWMEVQWLTEDLRDVYEIALESHDRNIIQAIGYLPIAIAHRAIKRLDHYIFEKSFGFLHIYYMYALREKDKDLQSFMKDRCGIYLKETSEYAIQYELDKIELGEDRIRHFRDFAIEIFLQLQHLMKQAYDARDLGTFQEFVKIGKKLFSHFKPSEEHPNADHFRWQLKLQSLSKEEKEGIERNLKEKEFLEGIETELDQKKNEMLFGLTSLILDQYRSDKSKKELLDYFNILCAALPKDLKDLTAVFLRCHNFDVEHFWGWDWWILPMDGEVHCIDFLGKVTFSYCVKVLQIINGMQEAAIEKVDLPYSRDFIHMIDKDDCSVKKIINDLLSDISQWDGMVPSVTETKKNSLFKVFDSAKEKQNREEEDFLINAKLSSSKVDEFVKGFLSGYGENCGIHISFEKLGQYVDKTKQEYVGEQKAMGYNRLDEKGAFIEGWYVHYSRWGEQYGSGIAASENGHLFEQLCEPLTPKQTKKENIINEIDMAIQGLSNNKFMPTVIVTSLDFDDFRMLSTDNRFIPHWHKDCPKQTIPNYHGILKIKDMGIPVIRLYREKNKGLIGIFDLKKFAILNQLRPIDDENESQYFHGQFYIRIVDLNEDAKSRNDIISSAPEWLNKYSDKERYLKTKVIVKTFMRQEISMKDIKAGFLLKVTDAEEAD